MRKIISSKNKPKLSIHLIICALLLVVGGTMAIYTSQVYLRSVIRNRNNDVIKFSSDKLYRVIAGTDAQKYYYPMEKGQNTMSFQVCNYDQSKNTLFNENRIEYTITFQVTNGTDGFTYSVTDGNTIKTVTNGQSVSFTNGLRGGKRSADSYSFSFADEDYNNIEVIVIVTPTDLTTTQNRILNGVLVPIEYSTTQGVTVKSEFTDSTRYTPDYFDAYNMLVSISGGSGNVLITWNNSLLDIDPFFAAEKEIRKDGDNTTIVVPMNSEDITGTYFIQFYNHNNIKPDWTKWSELPISVELETESVTE